jgi:hypothetical protein
VELLFSGTFLGVASLFFFAVKYKINFKRNIRKCSWLHSLYDKH